MNIIELSGLSKSYGNLKVTDDVSLSVPQGQALGIIGPNGAGKSTLFNLIAGNTVPDEGTISFFGQNVARASAKERCRLGIGRSFQIPQPFTHLTTFENLVVAASFGQNRSERDVVNICADILERTQLIDKANSVSGRLGLLDRKRLELARAMATAPKLLLLDEIAGGLTDGECQALIETIQSIHAQGITIIWIEHVLHALTSVVERLLVLDFGRVIAIGPPDEIMESREVKEIYLGVDI